MTEDKKDYLFNNRHIHRVYNIFILGLMVFAVYQMYALVNDTYDDRKEDGKDTMFGYRIVLMTEMVFLVIVLGFVFAVMDFFYKLFTPPHKALGGMND